MTAENHDRRRRLVVEPALQRRIVGDIGRLPVLTLILGVVTMGILTRRVLLEAEAVNAELPSLLPLFCAAFAFVVVSSFAILTHALRVSHRVAGPQVRFRRVIDAVTSGETHQRVSLRRHDYLHGLADDVNRLLDWAESREDRAATSAGGEGDPEPEEEDAGVLTHGG